MVYSCWRPDREALRKPYRVCSLSGYFRVRSAAGEELVVGPGEAFELSAGSDAWVEGQEPCVALDFLSYKAHPEIGT